MLLAIDIGNTNMSFGIFSGAKLIKRFDIQTHNLRKSAFLGNKFIDSAIICSVVPKTTKIVKRQLKQLDIHTYIIGKDIQVPIKNLYRKPEQVGQDRLVNAYAGVELYDAPLIIVDFGTAITFDVISKNKAYLGGMILPGLSISLDVLYQRTALLPKIKLGKPSEFIGRDTRNSMLSGIVYGFASLTDDLVARIKNKIGKYTKVIGTGGNINLISRYCQRFDRIDRDLTLKGLNLIYRNFLDSAAMCRRIK